MPWAKGPPEAPRAVSVGLRNCYLARFQLPLKLSKPSKPFAAAFDGLSLLCHGSSRGPTSCFCWASKLLSGTSEAPQAVSIGLRFGFETASWHVFSLKPSKASKLSQQLSVSSGLGNWHVFQHRLKPTKPSQQLSTAFRCFAMGPPEASRAVSVGLRNCYLALPKRHKLFLLGFETAIWHVFSTPKPSQQLSTAFRCFAMGPPEAPGAVSVGLRNCYLALPKRHKLFLLGFETAIWHVFSTPKPSQQLSTAFRCFAMGPPEAPRAVSVGLRNCYLALPKRHKLFLLGFETAIWHVFSLKPSKASKPSQQLATAFGCFAMSPPEAPRAVSVGFETAIWHFRSATSCFYWASKLLSGTFSAPLKTFKSLKTFARPFDGLSLLCHGTSRGRGPTSCFC